MKTKHSLIRGKQKVLEEQRKGEPSLDMGPRSASQRHYFEFATLSLVGLAQWQALPGPGRGQPCRDLGENRIAS